MADAHTERQIDRLFGLPLAEFTAERNKLAAGLKKAGQAEAAERVKALSKPSVSAWAVNQLFWKHKAEFQELIKASRKAGRAHAAQLTGKDADVGELHVERRKALSALLKLAESRLREGGHSPGPDVMRRVSTTLEAVTLPSNGDQHQPGRLTGDVDPPGFESLASLLESGVGPAAKRPNVDELERARHKLHDLRETAVKTANALHKATTDVEDAERLEQDAEARLAKARELTREARERLEAAEAEAKEAARALKQAEKEEKHARART